MGKFGDYVNTIGQQTELLRHNLTLASGEDCSGKSISQCADVVSRYIDDENLNDDIYVSPSWYPNIETIITNAPNITKNGTTYYPLYILLLANYESMTPFYSTNSTNSSAVNYYRGTGGQAVLCSDDCNKDIANADENTLIVGSTIEHTWDKTKDYTDTSGDSGYTVRWAIIYGTSLTTGLEIYFNGACPVVEIVIRQGKYYTISKNRTFSVNILKYFKLMEDANFSQLGNRNYNSYFLNSRNQLKTVILNDSITNFDEDGVLANTPLLSKLIMPKSYTITRGILADSGLKKWDFSGCTGISAWGNGDSNAVTEIVLGDSISSIPQMTGQYFRYLKSLHLPINLTTIPSGILTGSYCNNFRYVKIPSNITSWTNGFDTTSYIELFNDFDISGVSLTGYSTQTTNTFTKELKWFKDLCVWLKDKTGETANTMVLGSVNLSIMNNIYLTYNPNDKNDITFDGVTSSTTGAMSIVDYITNAKNWTLS